MLSEAQAITATAVSTNVIDLGVPGTVYGSSAAQFNDKGKGTPIPLLVQVSEAFNNCTSITVTVENSASASMTSPTVLATEVILLADLVVGKKTFLNFLPQGVTKRYLGVRYTLTGTAPTLGKFWAGITKGNQTNITGA